MTMINGVLPVAAPASAPCVHAATCQFYQSANGVHGCNGMFTAMCSTADVAKELVAVKRRANRREVYVISLRQYMARFAAKYPDLSQVGVTQIEEWLAQFASASSRLSWLNRISVLFSFAVRRGYLMNNPCERVERISVDRKAPAILTPKQARSLLQACPTRCKPYLVLALYAGVRPAEIERLRWSDVDLETATVKVDGKTRRRRIVPLEPIAVQLLSQCHKAASGRVTPAHVTLKRWKRKARELIGNRWPTDLLRHTAATYLLAKYEDPARVSYWLGNSPKILLSHYNNPVTQQACREFWRN